MVHNCDDQTLDCLHASKMSIHLQPPCETPRKRERISSFILRLRTQINEAMSSGNGSSKGSKMTCQLHKLPPELRLQIFKPLLMDWKGKTPNLIKALRPDNRLYNEALELFYKHNLFVLHKGNDWSFGDMTEGAVLSLERLKIFIETDIMKIGVYRLGLWKEELLHAPDRPISILDATNVHEVIMDFKWEEYVHYSAIPPFIAHGNMSYSSNYFLVPFPKLRTVRMIVPKPHINPGASWMFTSMYDQWEMRYGEGIKLANDRLGMLGKLSMVSAWHIDDEEWTTGEEEDHAHRAREEWFWQAEEGLFLRTPRSPPRRPWLRNVSVHK